MLAGRAHDDRLSPAQRPLKAVFFDRRVESADEGNAVVAQDLRRVVGVEDQVAGTAVGAEGGGQRLVE